MLEFRKIVGTLVLGLTLLTLVGADSVQAQQTSADADVIKYDVDLTDAKNHYVTIDVTIPVKGKTTELMMAVWTPGSYLVREYARNIDSMEATSGDKKLDFEKTRKNRWLVQTAGLKSFNLKYRLYCNEMSVRTNWVGQQYAMLNGAPTYITIPDRLDEPHIVQLKLPRNWTRSATSLWDSGDTPHTFVAEDFDELVDSPIVAGNINVYPFNVAGVEHQLVNIGESGYWDGTKAATDLKKVVQAHQEMWGVVPYDRYLFLNMIVESGGGLEHDNSTVLMTSRWTFRESGRYKSWLSLASHEFFHTWNVRRLRPKSLIEYDYENEVYTDSLWIAEGITSYYQDLALVRAGINTRSEFVSKLSRGVEGVQRTGGRQLQSLKDSSYDAWIKYYRPDENSSNTQISYYTKGAVVAFLLDAKIRKLTKGKKSLDDLMRKMFADFEETGFTTEDFRRTASDIAGQDLTDWFASVIDSTDELNYDDIEAIGIVVPNKKVEPEKTGDAKEKTESKTDDDTEAGESKKSKAANKKAEDKKAAKKKRTRKKKSDPAKTQTDDAAKSKKDAKKTDDSKSSVSDRIADLKRRAEIAMGSSSRFGRSSQPSGNGRPWLGFSSSASNGKVTVSGVKPGSPAWDVGLNNGDEVIAVEGYRITSSVDSRLSQYKVGDEIEILIARRGKLMTMKMTIGERESESWRLRLISKPSKEQQKQLDLWLGPDSK